MAQGYLQEQFLLNGAQTTGAGQWKRGLGALPSFHAAVTGSGAVTATILIWARNNSTGQVLLATIKVSGTNLASDGGGTDYGYSEYMAELTAITGAGAAATVVMSS